VTVGFPICGEEVTIAVPQRERILARVEETGTGYIDLRLLVSPRTSLERLAKANVFLNFVNASGVCRMTGRLTRPPSEARLRVVGYGAGELVRFEHKGVVQLLKRPDLVHVRVSAPITMLRVGSDHVAVEGVTVDVGGGGLTVRGLPGAAPGQLYQFDLRISDHEAPVSGQFRVDDVTVEGHVAAHFTMLGAHDRGRLVHFANDRDHGPSPRAA
jgi:hypothetical protein